MGSKENITLDQYKQDSIPDKSKHCNVPFLIDRSFIPTVPLDDQNGDLYNLGIGIYEQEALEREIIHQVDEALEKQKQRKFELELLDKEKDVVLVNNDNKLSDSKNTQPNNEDLCNSINFGNYELEESEMDRKIRMGEMTPFGTSMSFKSSEVNCFGNVEKYLRDQIEAEKRSKEVKRKVNANLENMNNSKNPEKVMRNHLRMEKKYFFPKKRKRKPGLGTDTSEKMSDQRKKPGKTLSERTALSESSCSEYLPTESDFSDKEEWIRGGRVKKKRRKVSRGRDFRDEDNWKTDDSNWEYSEDDGKELKKKSKCVRREEDDGNIDHYLRRLSVWEKNNNQEQIETEVKNLDGGFKVPLIIWNRLFNYQKVGVQWLCELHTQRCGGILGDEMGLGKTVQVIAFLSGLSVSKLISKHGSFKGLGPVLIICPTTVMHQWVREFHQWWPQFRVALMHESGNYIGKKSKLIQEIAKSSKGILITSFASCIQQTDTLTRYLWHYVIIDEGHKIRNPDSQIANSVKQLRTPHRLILSGSPMQNNLKELWSLFDFIFPGKLGTLPVFMSEFAVPITQGGYTNATQVQVATAFKCATVLRDTISPYLLRRVKEDVKGHINLPMKNEQVLFCKLTDEQRSLYLEYLNSGEVESILCGRYKVFVGLISLRKICNHPHLYTGGPKFHKWNGVDSIPEEERFGYWRKAGKMIVVETLLKIWKRQDHRVLIFTQSRQMLHILESFVQAQGYEYLKLDGSTSIGSRQPIIHKFNQEKKYFIFLSTTHVGGLGVNLTGADRVIIYDPDWNPATDTQARERAWRIGQEKQVTIYRLVTSGTIEEKIYHRQIFKQFLTNKVLKDPKQRRFFKSNDLYELFTLKDTDSGVTETAALFAGVGSEVNLKRLYHRIKSKNKIKKRREIVSSVLTKEKVESMKKLAKFLSQEISSGTIGLSKNVDPGKNEIKNVDSSIVSHKNSSLPNDENGKRKRKDKAHHSKRKEGCFATFEGQAVPHLMNRLEYKECLKLQNEYRKEQDDYILGKLFSKSGIKTAMRHDRIMEEGPSDYALVEGEAEKVAKEAVRALKESRKQYFQSVENAAVSAKPRFGAKSRKKVFKENDNRSLNNNDDDNKKMMTSSELLSRIKERNLLLNDNLTDLPTDHSHEKLELLSDIRNFVAFEGDKSNIATTQEIINRFRDRLPEGTSPLFRALLLEICEFHRESSGQGIWTLRQDFRW